MKESISDLPRRKLTAVAIYQKVHRATQLTVSGLQIIDQGLWLGIFNDKALDSLTTNYYQQGNDFCDREYNLSGFFSWENSVVLRFFPKEGSVLVAGCGGGREVIAFAKKGYEVEGFDCNQALVDYCNHLLEEERNNCKASHTPAGKIPEYDKAFNATVVGWGAYTHIKGRTQRIQFLQDLGELVDKDGLLLLSFWVTKRRPSYYAWIARTANLVRRLKFWNTDARIESGDTLEEFSGETYTHSFTKSEIADELGKAGFTMIEYSTDMDYTNQGYAIARKS